MCVVILELLDKPRDSPELPKLSLSNSLLRKAKQLYFQQKDYEYIHVAIHLYEIFDTLHQIRIIHSDIKSQNFIDYAITGSPVLFDFSISWVSMNGLLCLDRFRRKPRTFEERRDSELDYIERLVLWYAYLC